MNSSALMMTSSLFVEARAAPRTHRGRPPPDWTGTALTLWLVFHLLMSLAIWAIG